MPPVEEIGSYLDFCVVLDAGNFGRDGEPKVSDVPREIRCRWVEGDVSQGSSETIGIVATVEVLEDLIIGSVLWHGRLADFPRDWPEDAPAELVVIDDTHKEPSIDQRTFKRVCNVSRWRDELPTQE